MLDTLVAACRASFNLPVLHVVVTQQGDWLGFEGGFSEPGAARDFVLGSGGYPGYAVERYLKGEAPDAAMMVRIVTLSNLADEEEE